MTRAAEIVVAAVLIAVLATQAYIDLDVAVDLPGWHLDAPVADLLALGLVAALPFTLTRRERPPLPAPWAALAFLAVAVASAVLADPKLTGQSAGDALHWLVRKPVFVWVAYGVALPAALAVLPAERRRQALLATIGLAAGISLVTSAFRVVTGYGLWFTEIDGLTNNHKTLAVWMAPYTPWLWRERRTGGGAVVGVLGVLALLLSGSKTALIGALLGLAWAVHAGGRPLVTRWRLTALAVVFAVAASIAAPWVLRSRAMIDAQRSRHSLDVRAWRMVSASPLLGEGPGSAITWEMTEYPDYRINRVEAHGCVQKVASEEGLLGLLAWGAFTALVFRGLYVAWDRSGRRTDGDAWAWLGVATVLHVDLLASTETFTMTHWIPLGIAWAGTSFQAFKLSSFQAQPSSLPAFEPSSLGLSSEKASRRSRQRCPTLGANELEGLKA